MIVNYSEFERLANGRIIKSGKVINYEFITNLNTILFNTDVKFECNITIDDCELVIEYLIVRSKNKSVLKVIENFLKFLYNNISIEQVDDTIIVKDNTKQC